MNNNVKLIKGTNNYGRKNLKIAIQGGIGSNHHVVVDDMAKQIERELQIHSCDSFPDVFRSVETAQADFGLIAMENSLAGSILGNYDLLSKSELVIVGEKKQRIIHNLIALPGADLSQIKAVYSHEMALKQCSEYIENHELEPREYHDTADAVAYIMNQGNLSLAAIAPAIAAQHYSANILASGIETNHENFTRFVWLSKPDRLEEFSEIIRVNRTKQTNHDSKRYKAMLELIGAHEPGSLVKILQILADANLNLTKIQSRPIIGEAWNYKFYLDFVTQNPDTSKKDIEKILESLKSSVRFLRVLGIFEC